MEGRSFMGVGLALGIAIGTAIGIATGNLAIGIGLGVAVGMGLGVAIDASQRKKGGPENSAPLDGRDDHDGGSSDAGGD